MFEENPILLKCYILLIMHADKKSITYAKEYFSSYQTMTNEATKDNVVWRKPYTYDLKIQNTFNMV